MKSLLWFQKRFHLIQLSRPGWIRCPFGVLTSDQAIMSSMLVRVNEKP
jgi:hypothetical protein